ncbi:hypothetical protein AGR7C_Lc80219 [Agrobacterium deltaense Zutra 3/1]|uniref:Uncharacterized protein n=1 Tax=Agrobacterium deltaense Zutra 3/1 TaxID=1183427 RepID=A0A1S7S0L6_9HYPH|nr:hypothetical protein AGR7C_Lc80219 [Agrobacterium deltaense Zutra 3/1]
MTSALFVSHTGEKGGAELFLTDLVKAGPQSWRACFLSGGAAADDLVDAGRAPVMLSAGKNAVDPPRCVLGRPVARSGRRDGGCLAIEPGGETL